MIQTPEPNRLDEIDRRLETLEGEIGQVRVQLETNTATIGSLQMLGSDLLEIARSHQAALRIFQENAEADRAAIREIQAETRQIWQYLLSVQPNGGGSGRQ